MDEVTAERITARYRGRVQGVGFRWTTAVTLRSVPITGYVRNLADGSVELVVEGQPMHTTLALQRVADVLGHHIVSTDTVREVATGEFPDFRVRR